MRKLFTHCITALLPVCVAPAFAYDYSAEYAETSERHSNIPEVRDLQQDGARAMRQQVPVMIEFSTEWCEYCRALEEQVLEPMLRSGEYEDRVILRKLMVDDHSMVKSFNGDVVSASSLSLQAGVELYPTIVFFDGKGKEIVERIVGITVLDFIPLKIDKALERAKRELSSTPSGESEH